MVAAFAGPTLTVFEAEAEPNLLDLAYECVLPCASLDAELALRRALDIDAENNPFVRTSVDVLFGKATVKLCATHELPVGAADRRFLAGFYVGHLLGALRDWSPCGRGEVVEAA